MVLLVAVGLVWTPPAEKPAGARFSTRQSLSEVAPALGVTGSALARELGLSVDANKKAPLAELGIGQNALDDATAHLLSHADTPLKYFAYLALVLGAVVFLVRLGRPDGADPRHPQGWYPRVPYWFLLVVSVAVCGFMFGKSPNPMEGIVKVFKTMVGLYPDPLHKVGALFFFLLLAAVGNKVICGWACPFGSLQELLFGLPGLRRLRRRKPPFWLSNTVRALLFVVVLLFLFGVVGHHKGLVLYHYVNPFNLFNLDFHPGSIPITIGIVLVLGLVSYRPFCQWVCPFGLISWLIERLSLYAVRVDPEKCTRCQACIRACPTHAARGKVLGEALPADCFSCMRCLDKCPVDALSYAGPRPTPHTGAVARPAERGRARSRGRRRPTRRRPAVPIAPTTRHAPQARWADPPGRCGLP